MMNFKYITLFISLLAMSFLIDCKKVPEHGISEGMKEYFLFKPGSYWIYRDDYTGSLDSTYVSSYSDFFVDIKDGSKTIMKSERLYVYFQSDFLYAYSIMDNSCDESNYMMVSSHQDTVIHAGSSETVRGPVTYYPDWPENQKIIPPCETGSVFFYRTSPTDTINNVVYNNIIYSENQSLDSSLTNPYYYQRKITFSENAGIIKYFEIVRLNNINRSYTLVRYKAVK